MREVRRQEVSCKGVCCIRLNMIHACARGFEKFLDHQSLALAL